MERDILGVRRGGGGRADGGMIQDGPVILRA